MTETQADKVFLETLTRVHVFTEAIMSLSHWLCPNCCPSPPHMTAAQGLRVIQS